MFIKEEMLEGAKAAYKKAKVFGIITSIIMIILGIVLFFSPTSFAGISLWLIAIGLLVKGISDIAFYCAIPKGARDGWDLAAGIIWTVIALLMISFGLFGDLVAKYAVGYTFLMFIGFFIGFAAIFGGIKALCSCSEVKAMGGSTAVNIVGGILGILIGIFFIGQPIITTLALTWIYAIFLIVAGIALLCRALSYK